MNRRHKDFQSSALPTELPSRAVSGRAFNVVILHLARFHFRPFDSDSFVHRSWSVVSDIPCQLSFVALRPSLVVRRRASVTETASLMTSTTNGQLAMITKLVPYGTCFATADHLPPTIEHSQLHFAQTGNLTRMVVPSPGLETTVTSPRCVSTTRLTIAKPNPVPRLFVVLNNEVNRRRD